MERDPSRSNGARASSFAVLLVAALVQAWLAVTDHGIFWPDEIYQSLEQAHRFAFGYGIVPWEFSAGARSWLVPGTLGLWWKVLALLGIDDGWTLVTAAKLLVAALTVGGVAAGMRLAQRHGGDRAALLAGLLLAAHPAVLLLGHRALSEAISAPLLLIAVLLLDSRARVAGLVAGCAVFVRYQNGLALPVLLGALLLAPRRNDARAFAAGATAAVLAGAALDWLTWGAPFASAWTYLQFNVAHSSALFGSTGATFYAATALSVTGPALWLLAAGFALGARRLPTATALVVLYVLVHGAIPHKEFRFVYPVLPLFLVVAAVGLARFAERLRGATIAVPALGLALAALQAQAAAAATFGRWGLYGDAPLAAASPWHANEDVNRLLARAGHERDLCGVWLQGLRGGWSGGYAYFHRDAPLLTTQVGDDAAANYVLRSDAPVLPPIAAPRPAALGPEYAEIARAGGWALYRRPGTCAPAPASHDLY